MYFATSACCVVCVGSWRTYAPAVVAAVAMSTAALSERDASDHPGRNHRRIRASRADGTSRRHPPPPRRRHGGGLRADLDGLPLVVHLPGAGHPTSETADEGVADEGGRRRRASCGRLDLRDDARADVVPDPDDLVGLPLFPGHRLRRGSYPGEPTVRRRGPRPPSRRTSRASASAATSPGRRTTSRDREPRRGSRCRARRARPAPPRAAP